MAEPTQWSGFSSSARTRRTILLSQFWDILVSVRQGHHHVRFGVRSFCHTQISAHSVLTALRKEVDVVLAESLDRFSRDQEDTAGLFKRLTFAGVRIVTISEGDITFLHIGLKGTMNAMYLVEPAEKTHRGIRGRVENGKAGGGLCYGYTAVKRFENGVVTTGEREINDDEAVIIRRIFREYAAGASPKQIAKGLNRDGISGPQAAQWSPSTIHRNPKRGIGILHNELYVGRMVRNRQRFLKDPDTGKRIARPNPSSKWIATDVPGLRIVNDEMWKRVQERYASVQRKWSETAKTRFNQFRRPKYLFSGLTKCGQCGAGFTIHSREYLGCFGARERGTCTNKLRISRLEVESRVLKALQEKLLRQDLFEEFCDEFTREMNRLRMQYRADLTAAEREIERIEERRKKLVQSIVDDVPASEVKDELKANALRREALQAKLAAANEPPPLLHPEMSRIYRTKVAELATALQQPESRVEATEALRGLVDAIVLTPAANGKELGIELRGNLAAMLGATVQRKRSPESDDLSLQLALVAGGGFEPPTFGL